MAGGGVLPPLQDQGPESGLRQDQGGKHTGRPKTRHNRPHLGEPGRTGDVIVEDGGRAGLCATLANGPAFRAGDSHIHGINPLNPFFLSGVQRAPGDLQALDLPGRQTEDLGCGGLEGLGVVAWGEWDVPNTNHGCPFPAAVPAA